MIMILAAPMTAAMLITIYKQRNRFTRKKRRLWGENINLRHISFFISIS
jgi:hypothetical protein